MERGLRSRWTRVAAVVAALVGFAVVTSGHSGTSSKRFGSSASGAEAIQGLQGDIAPESWPVCDADCSEGPEPFELETDYIFPSLQRGVSRYVTSCRGGTTNLSVQAEGGLRVSAPGFEWQGARGEVRVPLRPGEGFEMKHASRAYHVRCLPENFPGWDFKRYEKPSRDFYSVAYGRSNDNEDSRLNPFVVVFDARGVPVWWQDESEGTLGGQLVEYQGRPYIYWRKEGEKVEGFLEDLHRLYTLSGRLAYQFESPQNTTDGHEFNLRPNGDVWLASYVPRANMDFSDLGGPESAWSAEAIVERVRDGETLWRWSSRRTIHTYESRRLLEGKFEEKDDGTFEDPYDRVHINSVEPAGDRVIVSLRNTDGVYGIDRRTGEIAWKLGGEETPESLEVIGDYYEYPQGAQHDARVLPDGTISIFDNRTGLDQHPRVTRWRIDEEEMTATLVNAYEDPLAPKSPATGSARFSPDGSLFVYWGDSYLMTEFDPEGDIAMRLAINGMAYRAFPVPDDLVGYSDFDRGMDAKTRAEFTGGEGR
jgi:hypothetical protein